jgi:hypothetical protein
MAGLRAEINNLSLPESHVKSCRTKGSELFALFFKRLPARFTAFFRPPRLCHAWHEGAIYRG